VDGNGLGGGQAGSHDLLCTRFQNSPQSVGQGPVGVGTVGGETVGASVLSVGDQFTG